MPIGKFKARASEMVHRVGRDKRPLVITLNGEPAAVLISTDDYDRQQYAQRVREAIGQGLADVEAGRLVSDDELGRWADSKFGKLKKTAKRR
jgi:prevent-host-death family protein